MDNRIYTMLGLDATDEQAQEKVKAIVGLTEERLLSLLGAEEVPDRLQYIVTEVAIMRYNRIGSEGTSSHAVEGETMSWNRNSDFDDFMDDINAYLAEQDTSNRGKLRFI